MAAVYRALEGICVHCTKGAILKYQLSPKDNIVNICIDHTQKLLEESLDNLHPIFKW